MLKLDSLDFLDVPEVAHGPDYKFPMGKATAKPSVSDSNYAEKSTEAPTSNFMTYNLDPAEAADPSKLFLPDMPEMSEVFAQTSADDLTHVDAEVVELDEDQFENFDYEIELYDDDCEPLVDDGGDRLIPWQEGQTYSVGQLAYLTAFASAYREGRQALQHTRTGRDYEVVWEIQVW